MATTEIPVLIMSDGPIRLGLAADPGCRGIECTLVECDDGSVYHTHANTVNSRTMDFCRRWGIAGAAQKDSVHADFSEDILYVTSLQGRTIDHI